MTVLLRTENVSKHFGGLKALNNVSIEVESDRITALIGPNGAGKTTLFNILMGFLKTTTGKVFFKDRDITNVSPNAISAMGVARSFQITRIFPSLSVIENAVMGCYPIVGENPFISIFLRKQWKKEETAIVERAMANLEIVGLADSADKPADSLGYAQRKLLEIARVLTADGEIILLDEPFSGIFGETTKQMIEVIRSLSRKGKAICLIEHNMDIVMDISDWIHVLNFGELITSGIPEEVRHNQKVIESYFGKAI